MAQNRAVRGAIAWGTQMCVTGSEDLSRVAPEKIEAASAGTFLGDVRIRQQMAAAAIWPTDSVPPRVRGAAEFAEPVSVDVPTLFLSGTHDPSTSPKWGAEAASHMPRGVHVVIPGGHGVFGQAVARLEKAFLERGSGEGLDLSEIEQLALPPLVLPGQEAGEGR